MKDRPIFLFLAGIMVLTLTACTPAPEEGVGVDVPIDPPAPTLEPTVESAPTPFRVQQPDVPPGDYAPWQMAYADFLRQLRQEEGELKNWVATASSDEVDEDLERWGAYSDSSEEYSLYDVDKDGIPELFIKYNNCEAGYHTTCYAFRGGQVVEAGEFASGHSCLYTWPEENAVLFCWGHMDSAYMSKYSMVGGILTFQDEVFSESIPAADQEEYTQPDRLVPGAEYISVYLSPTHWRPGDSPALLLPIYDYGALPRLLETPMEEAEVRAAVGRVLWENGEFYGYSGDGFYGDTGRVVLGEYLMGAYPYGDEPLIPKEYAFADVNGDGQTDCVLRLKKKPDEYGNVSQYYAVFDVRDGTVNAYFFGFTDDFGVDPDGSVYLREYSWWEQASFYQNQCYTISARQDPVEGADLVWDEFAPNP